MDTNVCVLFNYIVLFLLPEVFICGGYNGEMILSDVWKINLQTFQWTKLPAIMPEPAYFHCATVTPVSKYHTHLTFHCRAALSEMLSVCRYILVGFKLP